MAVTKLKTPSYSTNQWSRRVSRHNFVMQDFKEEFAESVASSSLTLLKLSRWKDVNQQHLQNILGYAAVNKIIGGAYTPCKSGLMLLQ